jgi:hypothetical protein
MRLHSVYILDEIIEEVNNVKTTKKHHVVTAPLVLGWRRLPLSVGAAIPSFYLPRRIVLAIKLDDRHGRPK